MARQVGYTNVSSFARGLITEASELNFPPDACVDEDNCDVLVSGNRRRRLGLDWDSSTSKNVLNLSLGTVRDLAISEHKWKNVNNKADLVFHVVQIGAILYFWDATKSVVGQRKSFTVDLTSYKTELSASVATERVATDSGDGKFFIVSKDLEPIYLTYDEDADTASVTQISPQIRDVSGIDDGLAPDEEPTTLSTEHEYNLKNQGWVSPGGAIADPLASYPASGKYPGNNKLWWVGKDANDAFSTDLYAKAYTGATFAPRGHFFLDPFNKDRDTASGLTGITTETINDRPQGVAFYAGRLFLGHKGRIYFSQIVDSDDKIGKFYQVNDPTEEDGGELLPSDGGVIDVPEMGEAKALFVTGSSILAFANNGLWTIKGGERGFRADEFQIQQTSDVGILSKDSLVDVEGLPFWWSDRGIYTITQNEVSLEIGVASITDQTIQEFFNAIADKTNIKGAYDRAKRQIVWLYEDEDTVASHKNKYNKAIILKIDLQAWIPHSFPVMSSGNYEGWIAGLIEAETQTFIQSLQNVTDSNNDGVIISNGQDVVGFSAAEDRRSTFLKYLTVYTEDATNYNISFSILGNESFFDWESLDGTGVDYTSYAISGYDVQGDLVRFKQNPYIYFFFKRTETGFTTDGGDNADFLNPSGCKVQTRWEWTDHENSGRWSREVDAYKFRRAYVPSLTNLSFDNGFPVVISRHKVRGKGKALSMKFTSVSGKDFNLLGWGMKLTGNSDV